MLSAYPIEIYTRHRMCTSVNPEQKFWLRKMADFAILFPDPAILLREREARDNP